MKKDRKSQPAKNTKANKKTLTIFDLPPRDTMRWNKQRKAIVVAAVEGGLITLRDARARYMLSVEEYLSWRRATKSSVTPKRRPKRAKTLRQIRFRQAA